MSEQEKEAIENTKKKIEATQKGLEEGKYYGERFNLEQDIKREQVLLNYIDKLQKVIDLMAFEIAENTGGCPLDIYDWENKKYDNCNNCNDTYKECFIEYFYKKTEE